MEKYQASRKEFRERTFFSQEGAECETRCVYDWIQCVENERGALICRTIKNNSYQDCKA